MMSVGMYKVCDKTKRQGTRLKHEVDLMAVDTRQ